MTINASSDTIRTAASAIGRAALFDDRVTDGDKGRIAAWAEAMEKFDLDRADVLDAVTSYYQGAAANVIKVGDVIDHARRARRDRETRAASQDYVAAVPDPQLAGLPIGGATGQPIWTAYEQHGAIDLPCRTCKAQPTEACIHPPTGEARKIPCASRISDGYREENS